MKRITASFLTGLIFVTGCNVKSVAIHDTPKSESVSDTAQFAIVDVRIITMNGSPIEKGTILVEQGTIIDVSDDVDIPEGIRVIDGTGLTAMPGLVDMHVHHFSEREGPMYIANGVTSVRNLWGTEQTIRLDHGARINGYIGPKVYSPGPLMDGPEPIWGESSLVVESEEQARGAIRAQKAIGYKAVKLYEKLTTDIYRAAVEEAKALGMQIYTHTPQDMSVVEVIKLQPDSLEHFEGAEDWLLPDDYQAPQRYVSFLEKWALADADKMKDLAQLFVDHNVTNSPTLAVIIDRYYAMLDVESWFASHYGAYVDKELKDWWSSSAARTRQYLNEEYVSNARNKQLLFLKTLHDSGAPLLIGTDTPNPFVVAGFAIHDEINSFIDAGIPNEEVLRIATTGAATFLGEEEEFGQIKAGLSADILLVNGDPFKDPTVLRNPQWVFVSGHGYDRTSLDLMLEKTRKTIAKTFEVQSNKEEPKTN